MFKLFNEYRVEHHLPSCTWDTGIFSEANGIYLLQDAGDTVLTGVYGEYIVECYIYDGERDSTTVPFFTNIALKDINADDGESSLIFNPRSKRGACLFRWKAIYVSYRQWSLTLIVGVSY